MEITEKNVCNAFIMTHNVLSSLVSTIAWESACSAGSRMLTKWRNSIVTNTLKMCIY